MSKTVMVQGSMSNVGKSLLVAGLCRIFSQDGYTVAPFKSQNMALNSFVTKEGLEMGRAQVMQCEAAGIMPSVRMNPILLKPTGHMGSQVIVMGEAVGNMSAAEYFRYKDKLRPVIAQALASLRQEYDIVVLEGAGSPAEINLKQNDIVNMGMAEMADAPVLLAGDIDRGGVFAQLYGTLMLLNEQERRRVKGLIINKFRGDAQILRPGILQLEELCQREVVGVVPYLDIDLEDEDSLAQRMVSHKTPSILDIVVIRLPHISNFTDFNPLETISGVTVRYVTKVQEMGRPDLVCLPGTKNTMDDLLWMRNEGLEAVVKELIASGVPLFGICGGYQMMGETLRDPEGAERGGELLGMGILPLSTVFQKNKTRTQVQGTFGQVKGILSGLSGISFAGYEIHMGSTAGKCQGLANIKAYDGPQKAEGGQKENCYGTYVHGIFDKKEVTKALVTGLLNAKGIQNHSLISYDYQTYKEKQYNLLADGLRDSLDMDKIYKILKGEV